tara:strand:- start:272 stop:388 length:117 start_codon:yes stop_codon:yes gene_type:complete
LIRTSEQEDKVSSINSERAVAAAAAINRLNIVTHKLKQ